MHSRRGHERPPLFEPGATIWRARTKVSELRNFMAIIYMTKRHDIAKPDSDRPAFEITDGMAEAGAYALADLLGDGMSSDSPRSSLASVASQVFDMMWKHYVTENRV